MRMIEYYSIQQLHILMINTIIYEYFQSSINKNFILWYEIKTPSNAPSVIASYPEIIPCVHDAIVGTLGTPRKTTPRTIRTS